MKLALKLSASSVISWIFLFGRDVEFITMLDIYADIKEYLRAKFQKLNSGYSPPRLIFTESLMDVVTFTI